MLNCKTATHHLAAEKATSGWREKLALRFHLILCKHCRRYAAQLRLIKATVRGMARSESETIENNSISSVENRILEKLTPTPGAPVDPLADRRTED